MSTHNPHFFLKAAENIAQLYWDDRKKNIFCTFGYSTLQIKEDFWLTVSMLVSSYISIYIGITFIRNVIRMSCIRSPGSSIIQYISI